MIFNRHFLNLFDRMSIIPNSVLNFFADSQYGLFYFFTLSGLVITLSFKRKNVYPGVFHFTIKRISRLFPVIFIAIFLGFIIYDCGLVTFKKLDEIQPLSGWAQSLFNFDCSFTLALKDLFYTLFCGFSYYDANFWTISYELYMPIAILLILKLLPKVISVGMVSLLFVISILLLGYR